MAMAVDLAFSGAWTPPAGGKTDLAFGVSELPAPEPTQAQLRIQLDAPRVILRAQYDNRVNRQCVSGGALGWQTGLRTEGAYAGPWGDTRRLRAQTAQGWRPAQHLDEACLVRGSSFLAQRGDGYARWNVASAVDNRMAGVFGTLAPHRAVRLSAWTQGIAAGRGSAARFVTLVPRPEQETMYWELAVRCQNRWRDGFAPGEPQARRWTSPWTRGQQPPPGQSQRPTDPVTPPVEPLHRPQLDFRALATQAALAWRPLLRLDFGTLQPGRVAIPILKVYFVSNHVEMCRLPGREPLPVKSVQISSDADSWAWGLTATLAYSALDSVLPDAAGSVEVEITINGVRWVMVVEGFEVRRAFGQATLTIQGRSRAAYLADPYAPSRAYAAAPATAQQLAVQELTRAGFVSGFDLDWHLPDWLVPEGAWSYEGLTPIAAIGRIVGAVSGTLNAHPSLNKLIAHSRYPSLPWEWATQTPDVVLPIDFVQTLGLRWQEKPAYNAVFVSGERVGITGQVVRAGSAGDLLAPMAVDALITHADAARERGRVVLADTGRQATVTLELPMPENLGLIAPGALVAVSEASADAAWRGLVRATRISADWTTSLTVRQSLELERHFF